MMRVISAVFHPLLIPTYLFGVFIQFHPVILTPYNPNAYLWLWAVVAITTFVIPVISMSFLRLTNNIPDFKLHNRKDRLLPFTFITFFYGVTSYMFLFKMNMSMQVGVMMIFTTLLIALLTVITFTYKISIHSAGIWGAVGILMAHTMTSVDHELIYPLVIAVVIAGLVNTARLHLNAHSPNQVLYGSVLGFLVCFLGVILFG
jgi:membrane-associated phospholipid phosphatase